MAISQTQLAAAAPAMADAAKAAQTKSNRCCCPICLKNMFKYLNMNNLQLHPHQIPSKSVKLNQTSFREGKCKDNPAFLAVPSLRITRFRKDWQGNVWQRNNPGTSSSHSHAHSSATAALFILHPPLGCGTSRAPLALGAFAFPLI